MSEQDEGDYWNDKSKSFNCVQEELKGSCCWLWTHVAAVEMEDADIIVGHQGVPNKACLRSSQHPHRLLF
jgi:hypothetical protein